MAKVPGSMRLLELALSEINEEEVLFTDYPTGGVDLDALFNEIPVPLEEFLYGKDFLGLHFLSDVQIEAVRYMSNVLPKDLTIKLFGAYPTNYNILVVVWGKGSGKDFVSRIAILRVCYLLLCFKSPQIFYGMSQYAIIHTINMAYSAEQAKNIFFDPLVRLLEGSSWFKGKYTKLLKEIRFSHGIQVLSGNSSQESFDGYNPLMVVLDEIDAFKSAGDMRRSTSVDPNHSAELIYNALRSSVLSRFPNYGKISLISYLRRPDGFQATRLDEAVLDPTMWYSLHPTWEVNPTRTREDFEKEFIRNPEYASRVYGCERSVSSDNFFRDREKVYHTFHYDTTTMDTKKDAPQNPFFEGSFLSSYKPDRSGKPRYLHVDIGISNDSAAICSVHVDRYVDEGDYSVPVVMVDFLAILDPQIFGEISISDIRDIIIRFSELCTVNVVTFDTYQSTDSIQILNKLGLNAGTRSVDRTIEAYNLLKDYIYCDRLECFGSRLLAIELVALLERRGKVDHPSTGSKDASDALAGALANLADDNPSFLTGQLFFA